MFIFENIVKIVELWGPSPHRFDRLRRGIFPQTFTK